MNLKDRLELLRLNNKYKSYDGIKDFRIALMDELTNSEVSVIDSINKVGCKATDKTPLNCDYPRYVSWAKQKIKPFVSCDSEIIIIEHFHVVFSLINDIEIFLEQYFERDDGFSIYLLNRRLKKCIVVLQEEYDLVFFCRDI